MLYYDKCGKTLQAEGYLTESQRHGRAGFSLTKLLTRLDNNIRLIDRPHGQHIVLLVEDDTKYIERFENVGHTVNISRQIYLTFPSENTFTEEDVSKYFNIFGPVQDLKIPCQQKRMFGFVTFESADTLKLILSHRNPHDVCHVSILVKSYREKPKLVKRHLSFWLKRLFWRKRWFGLKKKLCIPGKDYIMKLSIFLHPRRTWTILLNLMTLM